MFTFLFFFFDKMVTLEGLGGDCDCVELAIHI
jgi:hypothetical protein